MSEWLNDDLDGRQSRMGFYADESVAPPMRAECVEQRVDQTASIVCIKVHFINTLILKEI